VKPATRPCETPLPPDWRRRGEGATIRLPALAGKEAWLLVAFLEQVENAIWQAHGVAMADYQARTFPDLPTPPCIETLAPCPRARRKDLSF